MKHYIRKMIQPDKSYWDRFTMYSGKLGFYVRSTGKFYLAPGVRTRVKRTDFCEILWCLDGRGTIITEDGRKYELLPGWVWYYPPGSLHRHGAAGNGYINFRWLTIAGPQAEGLFTGLGIQPGLNYAGKCPEDFFDRIAKNTSAPEKMPELLSWAFHILTRIAIGPSSDFSADSIAFEARVLIDEEFRDPSLNVEKIAERLQRHRVSVARDFKEKFGMTISSYLISRRSQEGSRLIRESNIPLNRIPPLCGFSSIHYFSRVIRKLTGMPPGELRKR